MVGFAKPAIVGSPKAEDPEFVHALAARFADHGAATALMIETAAGVACAMELMGRTPRCAWRSSGSADLHVVAEARPDPAAAWEHHALSRVLLAARRYGHLAITTPSTFATAMTMDFGPCRHRENSRLRRQEAASTRHRSPWSTTSSASTRGSSPGRGAFSRRGKAGSGGAEGVVAMDGEMIEVAARHAGANASSRRE